MRRLHKYLALSPAGRATVRSSLLLLPMVAALLRLRGLAGARAAVQRLGRRGERGYPALAPREMARLVDGVALILNSGCLPRSLVLWHLLHRSGVAAEIHFGVNVPRKGELSAHAWVEVDGRPVNDSADVDRRYSRLSARA